ncbi:MAG: hypothetical protein Q4E13_03460 [Clostridia bacterium]|nr:hypothetical protein [Clostridia bacterium]
MYSRWMPVCRGGLKRLLVTPRCWAVLIISALYLESVFAPIRDMLAAGKLTISLCGLMVFLLNDATVTTFMALAFLALLFDAPCTDEMQRYSMLRTGRGGWALGQLAYGACVALAYLLVWTLMAALFILPYADFSLNWSEGILAFTDGFAFEIYDSMLNYDSWLIRSYAPVAAWALECLLHALAMMLLGAALMNLNALVDRRLGFAAVAVPVVLDMLLQQFFGTHVYYYSPLTLCRLSGLDYGDGMGRPSVLYALAVLALGTALLSALFVWSVKRREIRL